jgi:hypothetical protein
MRRWVGERVSALTPGHWAGFICVAFVALAVAYSIANPSFEAVDEIRHFRYVRYLTLNRALPPVSIDSSKELQAHHPPLYYALVALLTAPIPSDAGPDYAPPINPFWGFRYFEPSTDNKNQYLHSSNERWQFSGVTLIVYLGRWLSMAFGLGTLLVAYRLGHVLFPDRPALALGAMAFVAFNPMFLHGSASLNNDTTVAFFGAWAILESVVVVQSGSTPRRAITLGIALGLGILSKASALPLTAVAAASFVVAGIQRDRRRAMGDFGIAVAAAILVCGWWFVRNYLQTGDAMGLREYQSAWVGEADRARLIGEALSGLPYAWTTFWARFDYGQIVLPDWVYVLIGLLCLLSFLGLIRAWREFRSPGLAIAAFAVLVSLAGWGALMITIPATANARLVFQIFPALGLLLMLGWQILLTRRHEDTKTQSLVSLGFGILEFGFSLFALFGYLAPAFAYPRFVTALPADAVGIAAPVSANFEGAAEILGYRASRALVQPGDQLDVTVYWRPLAQTAAPLQVFVHLVDTHGVLAAQRDTYPGLGNAVTTTWRVGQTFADTYRLFIPETAYSPETLTLRVGLWSAAENRPLIANDRDALDLGPIDLRPRDGQTPNSISVNFANRMTLIGYDLNDRTPTPGETIQLTTYWLAVQPEADYWAYAHLVGMDGRIWALADSVIVPPITGWPLNELRSESRPLIVAPDTPPGQYVLEFGLTHVSEAGQSRLPILAGDGHEIGDHIELARIKVMP